MLMKVSFKGRIRSYSVRFISRRVDSKSKVVSLDEVVWVLSSLTKGSRNITRSCFICIIIF